MSKIYLKMGTKKCSAAEEWTKKEGRKEKEQWQLFDPSIIIWDEHNFFCFEQLLKLDEGIDNEKGFVPKNVF